MKSALDGIRDMEIPEGAKRIAVLSDIAQAGDHTEEFHSEVGRYAAESNLDILICQGENAETVAKEAKADPELKIYIAGSREDAERLLEEIVTERDIVLLKGSHSTKLHTIPDDLLGTWFSESGGRKILNEGSEYIVFSELGTGYLRSADKTLDNFVIPEKIEDMIINGIGEESFKGSALRSISIPETIRNIRKGAFEGSRKLKNIALPGSVMYIDDEAFKDCTGLREVVLTDNIRHISDSAFEGCKKLHFICSEGSYAYNYALRMGLKIKN